MFTKTIMLAALVAALTGAKIEAACGDKITIANGSTVIIPQIISWDTNIEESMQVAQIKRKPFAIYFSCKEDAKVVGENETAIRDHMRMNSNSLPTTVTDVPKIVAQAREMGVGSFVKVPITKETREMTQKYAGESNLLVVVAPNGEIITTIKCTADTAKATEIAKKELAAWQSTGKNTAAATK